MWMPPVVSSWLERVTHLRSVRLIEPASSRGGRRFEAIEERDLHGFATDVAASMPGPIGDVLLVAEMPSPLGVPDFVALIGGQDWQAARASAGVPPVLSDIDCTVLSLLSPTRALSVVSLVRRTGWSVEHVERTVTRLRRVGAAMLTGSGAVLSAPGMKPSGSLFAIETKVKNWQRALIQGRGYRTWADNYVLILGNAGPKAAQRAVSEVTADGAGLYTEHGWLVRPRRRLPSAARRTLGFEFLYAAVASGPSLGASEEVQPVEERGDPATGANFRPGHTLHDWPLTERDCITLAKEVDPLPPAQRTKRVD